LRFRGRVCDSPTLFIVGASTELRTICPRVSCVLQAYYSVCQFGHDAEEDTPAEFLNFLTAHEEVIEFLIKRYENVVVAVRDYTKIGHNLLFV